MTKPITKSALSLTTLGLVVLLHATPVLALSTKTWVSHDGNDTFTCNTPAAACATFFGAILKTAPGGEVGVVNSGDYGRAPIGQSVHITNDGAGEAAILNSSGVIISAGNGDIVSLRGLVIDGQVGGVVGIDIQRAAAVHIQNCVIRNYESGQGGLGILLETQISTQLFVSDTLVFNNGSTARTGGILISPVGSLTVNVVLDRVHLENNVIGLWVDASQATGNGVHLVMRDSVVSGNAGDGILASSLSGQGPAFMLLENTSAVNNAGLGIHADGPHATILLKNNTITRNGAGISAVNGGQLISYGNNTNNNNIGAEGAPTGLFSQM